MCSGYVTSRWKFKERSLNNFYIRCIPGIKFQGERAAVAISALFLHVKFFLKYFLKCNLTKLAELPRTKNNNAKKTEGEKNLIAFCSGSAPKLIEFKTR